MTVQLATRVSPKAKLILEKLNKRTHIPICQLTEKAILLLEQHYRRMQEGAEPSRDERFAEILERNLQQHEATYRALAK